MLDSRGGFKVGVRNNDLARHHSLKYERTALGMIVLRPFITKQSAIPEHSNKVLDFLVDVKLPAIILFGELDVWASQRKPHFLGPLRRRQRRCLQLIDKETQSLFINV